MIKDSGIFPKPMVAKVRDMMKTRGRSQLSKKGQNKNANQAKGNV